MVAMVISGFVIVMWHMVYDFDFSRSLFLYSLVPTVCEKISTAFDAFVFFRTFFSLDLLLIGIWNLSRKGLDSHAIDNS